MDISTAPGPSDALGTETSASPIDPALTGAGKGKRRADDDDGEGDDGSAATKKRRNRKVRRAHARYRPELTLGVPCSRSHAPVSRREASRASVYPAC